ncbi:MAG: HlyD family secretion protein [Bacteroidales bacterium]|jgi:multidrug resistance efflux pump|nr:HlyD family secretion protein [Bacteroidales bacterium]
MKYLNIQDFNKGYQFFMLRPTKAINIFILTILTILILAILWSLFGKMDDIIKADVLLRPVGTISSIKTVIGGEVIEKNYIHGTYVKEGENLLKIDITSEIIDLENSKNLMERLKSKIEIYQLLGETIKNNKNNLENKIQSEAYLLEYNRMVNQIEGLKSRLIKMKMLPDGMFSKQEIEDKERELEQYELQFSAWKKNQLIEVNDNIILLLQNKESLEKHVAELERNIKYSNIIAPISGNINEKINYNVGDNLMPGEEILTIIPVDLNNLKAELYINPSNIAQIKIGQTATLRFPSLPPSKYGKLETKINLIPADYTIGINSEPIFIVESIINNPWLMSPKNEKIYLRPGMGAEGRVIIEQDTIIRMILKKLDFIN